MKVNFFVILATAFFLSFFFAVAQNSEHEIFLKNRIIFKIKPAKKEICSKSKIDDSILNDFLASIDVLKLEKKFPFVQSPKNKFNKFGQKNIDISTIYEIEFNSNISIYKIINYLSSLDIVEYAQPVYIDKICGYVPNDPQNGNQYYLNNIRAYDAWELAGGKGDSTIVIGIVDTGVDFVHEDLIDNIFYNYSDTLDGIDNDNDGYVDNYRGWDVANNDNNPMTEQNTAIGADTRQHGTYVAGCAAARTDNGKGISGPGFNSKFLPVKVLNSDGYITAGYEGILYAAEHGCKIINCSWGGCFGHPFGQDIINYVTYNKNALVIAAAGNSNCGPDFVMYPAAYENVIAVAGTNANDNKWNNSTYGEEVDVSTPGENILFTKDGNGYKYGWGTSFASPITSGAAAIIAANFPTYTALQIGERLRVTTDNIDTVSGNEAYVGMLGTGRTNMYRAISTSEQYYSIRFENISYASSSGILSAGDTVYMSGIFRNYLDDAVNVNVKLTTDNPSIEILQPDFLIGSLASFDSISNNFSPYIFVVNSETDFETTVVFKLLYENINQNDYQYIIKNVTPTYLNIYPNKISTTVCSNGRIGYNTYTPLTGIGLQYKNDVVLYEGGLMVGNSNTNVSSSIRTFDDYIPINPSDTIYEENVDNSFASSFKSISHDDTKSINFEQKIYSWESEARENFIISEYALINNDVEDFENLYVSIFTDWDLVLSYANKTSYNSDLKLGYTYNTSEDSLYAGIKVLSHSSVNHYGIDNVDGGSGTIDISDGFSIEEQFFTMTNNRHYAGADYTNGTDVCEVIGIGPLSIVVGDTVTVSFAFIVAENKYKLINSANEAQYSYDYLHINSVENNLDSKTNINIYPNPSNSTITIQSTEKISEINIYDLNGSLVYKLDDQKFYSKTIDTKKFSKGMYIMKLRTSKGIEIVKFSVLGK